MTPWVKWRGHCWVLEKERSTCLGQGWGPPHLYRNCWVKSLLEGRTRSRQETQSKFCLPTTTTTTTTPASPEWLCTRGNLSLYSSGPVRTEKTPCIRWGDFGGYKKPSKAQQESKMTKQSTNQLCTNFLINNKYQTNHCLPLSETNTLTGKTYH